MILLLNNEYVAAFAVVLVASISTAQTAKIAYVNSETILRELPEAQQVKKELETTIKVWQDELERLSRAQGHHGLDCHAAFAQIQY